ncbi:hypothetical protein [Bacillus cereus group sp. TH152-1LC]|uniref:hypothetical protein n=1 Tax=Bacillus cereus group sp. TH152-1LC TaxID=3018060 RepID=UPI0022E2BCA3|nr:hypothetical protein [Bacillus cereus group sp. TH152-1LC]MDA1675077.1 hypothetical protein [Bacillus cereus group sp. TH152-1LC]
MFMKRGKQLVEELKSINKLELKKQIKEQIGEENRKKEQETIIENPYRPTKKTIEKLKRELEGVGYLITVFSPYKVSGVNSDKKVFSTLLAKLFGYNTTIKRMEEGTKKDLIVAGIEGLQKTFYVNRQRLLLHGTMFENDFLENRLEYVMKNGEEAEEVSESVYDFLEQQFIEIMKEAMYIYFDVKESRKNNYKLGLSSHSDALLFQYRISCLTGIDDMNDYFVNEIHRYFAGKIYRAMFDELKEVYPKCKIRFLTYQLVRENEKNELYVHEYDYEGFFKICEHFEQLKELFDAEELETLLNAWLLILDAYQKAIDSKVESKILKHSESLAANLETIEEIMAELENKKENK